MLLVVGRHAQRALGFCWTATEGGNWVRDGGGRREVCWEPHGRFLHSQLCSTAES